MSKRLLKEEQIETLIYKMVMESLNAFDGNMLPQERKEDSIQTPNSGGNDLSNGPEDETSDEKKVRNNVEKFLNMPGINDAAYAYALYNVPNGKGDNNEKKNARHKIEAKKNHDPDSNGNPQYFTPKEAIKLNHLRTSGITNLRENKNEKVLMNKEQFNKFITEMVNESVKRILNEISTNTLKRAREKAHQERMHTNNYGLMKKRSRQYNTFSDEINRRRKEEEDSVCPSVPESELRNMPEDTYVVLDGCGRDFYWNIIYRYSGHAGKKEQCMEYINRFCDKSANWEFLPEVVSLEEYFKNYA